MIESVYALESKRMEGLKLLNYPFFPVVYRYLLTAFNQCDNPQLMNFLLKAEKKYIDGLLPIITPVDTINVPRNVADFLKEARAFESQDGSQDAPYSKLKIKGKLALLNRYQLGTGTVEIYRTRVLILLLCGAILKINFPEFYAKLVEIEASEFTSSIFEKLNSESNYLKSIRTVSWKQRLRSILRKTPEQILYSKR